MQKKKRANTDKLKLPNFLGIWNVGAHAELERKGCRSLVHVKRSRSSVIRKQFKKVCILNNAFLLSFIDLFGIDAQPGDTSNAS